MQRLIFRLTSRIHVFLYRLTGGRLGSAVRGFHILLLTTTGRKSGKQRTTPLGYFEYDDGYVITASNAGLDRHPGWFYNLKSNPRVEVQIKDAKKEAVAEQAEGELRGLLWEQLIEHAPGYADYENSTTREIPMVILRPVD
jgi:deazaflavin-dependent oxidoreductase (nitroreductase family)